MYVQSGRTTLVDSDPDGTMFYVDVYFLGHYQLS